MAKEKKTKKEKKALRKAYFEKFKTVFPYIAGGLLSSITLGIIGFNQGKRKGLEYKDDYAYEAMNEYHRRMFEYAVNGDYASEIKPGNGKTYYMTYTVSENAPDWWTDETTKHFDLKEEILD